MADWVECSDCGTWRPPHQMDWYPPNPLSIEWVCKLGLPCPPDDEPAPRRYAVAQTKPYVRITRR